MNTLFSRIVVGIDGSEPSNKALTLAARLAHEHDGRLLLCHAVNWMPLIAQIEATGAVIDPTPMIDGLNELGRAVLAKAEQTAHGLGAESEVRAFEGEPAESILQLADEEEASLIVMGTHGRIGLGRLFIGSTAEAVLRGSTLPVLAVRTGTRMAAPTRRCFERILVGVDDSEPSDAAIEAACALPPEDRRNVLACSVADVDTVFGGHGVYYGAIRDELHEQAQRIVDTAVERAHAHGVTVESRILDGSAGSELIAAANEQAADLIVLGSHGRRGLRRLFLGSVAENVVRTAPVPVLVVRTRAASPSATVPAPSQEPAHV